MLMPQALICETRTERWLGLCLGAAELMYAVTSPVHWHHQREASWHLCDFRFQTTKWEGFEENAALQAPSP